MADASGVNDTLKRERERSPSFPYIGLTKAVERTRQLYEGAKRSEVLLADAAKSWGMQPKSSSTLQTAAALLAFGLIEDSGSGISRKIKVTDVGARILGDARPGVRESLLAEAARKPRLIAEYAAKWQGGRPDDHFCISELKYDKGFNDEAAARFLRVFDETMRYIGAEHDSDDDNEAADKAETPNVRIGDFVQWTSGGVDQFPAPSQVTALSEDKQWLWVSGSDTGIPVGEITVVEVPDAERVSGLKFLRGLPPHPRSDTREEKFALSEGDVIISYPERLSADSVDDLDSYLQVFLKKVRRAAGTRD